LLFSKASRSALESIHPLCQWVLRAVSGGGGRGGGCSGGGVGGHGAARA